MKKNNDPPFNTKLLLALLVPLLVFLLFILFEMPTIRVEPGAPSTSHEGGYGAATSTSNSK